MREIKFRVYDEESKKIYQITDINFSDYVANGVCYGDWKDFSINNLLQYTGLKDKNGVEIYEGDIIYLGKMFKNEKENNINGVVEFNVNCFGVPCFCIKENDDIFHSFFNIRDSETFWFEVIGNIYENKDLLE